MAKPKNRINIYLSENIMYQTREMAARKHISISGYISGLISRDIDKNFENLKENNEFNKLITILEKIENNTRK